jgi:predicted ATPase
MSTRSEGASPLSQATRRTRRDYESARVPVPMLTRVSVKNYRSIEGCSVRLEPLTLLVGPNGAGKSNFLDAIRITADALKSTLQYALRERGGIGEVRRRSRGHPTHFGIRLDLNLAPDWTGSYAYQVAARKSQTFEIQREECWIYFQGEPVEWFQIEGDEIRTNNDNLIFEQGVASDSLFLPLVSGLGYYRRLFQLLSNMGFYNLNLDKIRELQNPDVGEVLLRDGANLAAVIRRINEESPRLGRRIGEYLNAVVPGVRSVGARTLGPKETIEFRQEVSGDANPWRYLAASVSDGTLRALGVLVAVFQASNRRPGIPLVAIEEPEIAIHPGAAVRLMDALLEASKTKQILLTTHSPDLLDHPELKLSSILAVEARAGNTIIGPVGETTKKVVRENLYTVGELLRLEQVSPDLFSTERQLDQLRLFGSGDSG